MIVPSLRLIGLAVFAVFPALVAGAVMPQLRVTAGIVAIAIALAAAVDYLWRDRAFRGITASVPPIFRFVQGRAAAIPLTLLNESHSARKIRIGFAMPDGVEAVPEHQILELPPAMSRVDWVCRPHKRGNFKVDRCYLEARSPLGLWTIRTSQTAPMEMRVYPNLRDKDSLQALRRGSENLHLTRQIGRGREFEKLREYAPGDGSDEIHWKASARRGRPITKVFQVERTQEIYLVIDSSRLSARSIDGELALERAIKAALTIGAVTERRGDLFGLAAFSDRVEVFIRARAGQTHYAACREALNTLKPRGVSPDFEEIATMLRLRLSRRSLVIFLTSLDDPVLAQHFERAARLLSRRHLVIAAMLRPKTAESLFSDEDVESSGDIYRALAGHLGWEKLRELQKTLSRFGVQLALMEPKTLSTGLVQLYDEVKQRQLI